MERSSEQRQAERASQGEAHNEDTGTSDHARYREQQHGTSAISSQPRPMPSGLVAFRESPTPPEDRAGPADAYTDISSEVRPDDIVLSQTRVSRHVLDVADSLAGIVTPAHHSRSPSSYFSLTTSDELANRGQDEIAHVLDQANESLQSMSLAQLTGLQVASTTAQRSRASREAALRQAQQHVVGRVHPEASEETHGANSSQPSPADTSPEASTEIAVPTNEEVQALPTFAVDEGSDVESDHQDNEGANHRPRLNSAPSGTAVAHSESQQRVERQRSSRRRLALLYRIPRGSTIRMRSASPRLPRAAEMSFETDTRAASNDEDVRQGTAQSRRASAGASQQDATASRDAAQEGMAVSAAAHFSSQSSPFVTAGGVVLQGTAMSSTFATPLSPMTPSRSGVQRGRRRAELPPRRRVFFGLEDTRRSILLTAERLRIDPERYLFVHALHVMYKRVLDFEGPAAAVYEERTNHSLLFDVADHLIRTEQHQECYKHMRAIHFLRGIATYFAAVEHDVFNQIEANYIQCLTAGVLRFVDRSVIRNRSPNDGSTRKERFEEYFDFLLEFFCQSCLTDNVPSSLSANAKLHRVAKYAHHYASQAGTLGPIQHEMSSTESFGARQILEADKVRRTGTPLTNEDAEAQLASNTLKRFLDICRTHPQQLTPKAVLDDDPECKKCWCVKYNVRKHTHRIAPDTVRMYRTYREHAEFKRYFIIDTRPGGSALPLKVVTSHAYRYA